MRPLRRSLIPTAGGPLAGSATRGLAYWTDGRDERIVALIGGRYLTALNARTGTRYPNFGDSGEVDLRKGQERGATTFSWRTGPTVIVRGVIVIGSMVNDINSAAPVSHKTMPPGDVRGIDVRTGKQLWLWHAIPGPGEVGHETWLEGSASYSGNTNVWGPMSGDEELGLCLSAGDDADQRLVRRAAQGRQSVCGEHGGAGCADRKARVALPGGSPRSLGLRFPVRA